MLDFSPYKLIPYDKKYENTLIGLLAKCYAAFEPPEVVELTTLDNDLLNIDSVYKEPSTFRLLVDANNKLIGTVAVKLRENGDAEMKRVFLDPEYRGKGLGKKLSQWTFEYAIEKGAKIMHIWSGIFCHEAHALYKHLGAEDMNEKRSIGGLNNIEEFYFTKELAV